jgi:hypothetical protein
VVKQNANSAVHRHSCLSQSDTVINKDVLNWRTRIQIASLCHVMSSNPLVAALHYFTAVALWLCHRLIEPGRRLSKVLPVIRCLVRFLYRCFSDVTRF